MANITKFDLEQSVADTEALQKTLAINKYTGDNEHSWSDIIDRMISLIENDGPNQITEPNGRKRFGYTPDQIDRMQYMLASGHFVPGGSILSGTVARKDGGNKSSLSNCYVLQIKNDSIESICDCLKEACRTYSYRGGVGIDISVLRPDGSKVHNAARTSSGAVSFMPMISTANQTIGTCLAEGTRIKTRRGLIPIEEIVEKQDEVWTRIGWVKVDKIVKSEKEVYALETWHGNTVEGSLDHEFQTINEKQERVEKPLKDFKEGDPIVLIAGGPAEASSTEYVPLKQTDYEFSSPVVNQTGYCGERIMGPRIKSTQPSMLTEDFAYVLGYMYGNGFVTYNPRYNHPVSVSVACPIAYPTLVSKLTDLITELFGHEPSVRKGDGEVLRISVGYMDLAVFLKENELLKEKAAFIKIPEKIFRSPDTVQMAFVSGFFDADGSASGTKSGYKFSTISKQFALGLQLLLSSNGISSNLYCQTRIEENWNDLYGLTVHGTAAQRFFIEKTPWSTKVQTTRFIASRDFTRSPYTARSLHADYNHFPYMPGPDILLSVGTLKRWLFDERRKADFSEDNFAFDSTGILYMSHVKSITKIGKKKTYDLKLPVEHLFFANGIYTHNCGRRAAMMTSIDCRHPDVEQFIWSKADPHSVFAVTRMSHDISAVAVQRFLAKHPNLPADVSTELNSIAWNGKVPDVNTANISVKFTNEFMEAVASKDPKPWICYFPDIDANRELYETKWDGDYERWVENGGTFKEYDRHYLYVTDKNYRRFIGRKFFFHRGEEEVLEEMTKESLLKLLEQNNNYYHATIQNPSAYQIFLDLAMAAWMRGDPGVLFWDHHLEWSTFTHIHPRLKPMTTNPCGEENLFPGSSCLLGAQVFSSYVKNPWEKDAAIDWKEFIYGCYNGALLMQFFSDSNEDRHPLPIQCEMEKFAKRIGVEFTGFADMLSMVGIDYGSAEAESLGAKIAAIKNYMEFCCSVDTAEQLGPCPACDPKLNLSGLENMMAKPYFESAMDGYKFIKETGVDIATLNGVHVYSPEELKEKIRTVGLRNVAFNTVGPTGSVSIMAGNCSSGIEPVFALFYTRHTRVGDRESYNVCHAPIAKYLLKHWEELGYDDKTELDSAEIKKKYHIVEAHELDYHQRIKMQMAMQRYCDSSISSTVNLPESSKPEDIVNIYLEAWETGLKGITIFRTGSLNSVLEVKEDDEEVPVQDKEEDSVPEWNEERVSELLRGAEEKNEKMENAFANLCKRCGIDNPLDPNDPTRDLQWGDVVEIGDKIQSYTHTVHWRGAKFYVIVSTDDHKRPMQMFISSLPRAVAMNEKGEFNNESYHNQLSNWTALMRMISITLRAGVDAKVVVKQLRKSSFTMMDMMSIVARVLDEYTGAHEQTEEQIQAGLTECPECHKHSLRHEGGCATCQECGYSRCS